jgi:ankyrin repeat protein
VLHYAAMQNHCDVVRELVSIGVQVDSVEVRGYTPLHLAVVYGRTKLVEYLVNNAGADLTKKDPQGFDVLQIAFQKGDLNMAKLLLRQRPIRDRYIFLFPFIF